MRGKVCAVAVNTMFILMLLIYLNPYAAQAEVLGFETNVTNDTVEQRAPAIWGDRIVWNELIQEAEGSFWEIFLYELSIDSDGDSTPNYLDEDRPEPDPAKIRITFNASHKYNPDIHGDIIVWEDNRYGNSDIFMYDLTMDSDNDTIPNYLDDDDDGDGTLDWYDTDPDSAEERITESPSHQEKPKIYGRWVIWTDLRYGNRDIYIYDIITGEEVLLAGYKEEGILVGDKVFFPLQRSPHIHYDKVVWEDSRTGSIEIFMYNLSLDSDSDGIPNFLEKDRPHPDPAEFQITNNSKTDFQPSIFDNNIAYVRSNDVYLYDILTGIEYKITNSTSGQNIELQACSMHGSKIVFSYGYDYEYYVYIYDLAADTDDDGIPNYRDPQRPTPDPALDNITEFPEIYSQPVIYNNKITWQDDRNGSNDSYDIYLFEISGNQPPEISYSGPDGSSEIEEGRNCLFNITASDPDGDDLVYRWYVDDRPFSEETDDSFNYSTDFDSAGFHQVRVVVSDGEYFTENIWSIQVLDSDVIKITDYEPKFDPVLNETESISFTIEYSYFGSGVPIITWHVQGAFQEPMLEVSGGGFSTIIEAPFDSNESDSTRIVTVTTWVTDGIHNVSHMWNMTVNYFNDYDGDNYSDATEVAWSSNPLLPSSTPPDLDGDFIVDGEDDDIDGDGYPNDEDAYPLDPNRHEREEDGNTLLIIGIVVIIVVVLVFLLALPRMRNK